MFCTCLLVGLTKDILILQYAARSAIRVLVYIWNSFILEFILTDSFDLKNLIQIWNKIFCLNAIWSFFCCWERNANLWCILGLKRFLKFSEKYPLITYNPHKSLHFLLLEDYFPAVANLLKWRSYICMSLIGLKCGFTHAWHHASLKTFQPSEDITHA